MALIGSRYRYRSCKLCDTSRCKKEYLRGAVVEAGVVADGFVVVVGAVVAVPAGGLVVTPGAVDVPVMHKTVTMTSRHVVNCITYPWVRWWQCLRVRW